MGCADGANQRSPSFRRAALVRASAWERVAPVLTQKGDHIKATSRLQNKARASLCGSRLRAAMSPARAPRTDAGSRLPRIYPEDRHRVQAPRSRSCIGESGGRGQLQAPPAWLIPAHEKPRVSEIDSRYSRTR